MIIRGTLLLQSLLVGVWPPGDDSRDSGLSELDSSEELYEWPQSKITPIPDPKDYARMARFIVHNANWTSVAYISHQKGSEGRALADMFSVSDGPVEAGAGFPYFYVSRLEAAVSDLLDNNNQCSLTMGLQQTPFCKERQWDDEDPRCAHLVLTGTFQVVNKNTPEYPRAQNALFSRHPSFKGLPANHQFFIAKYSIESITLQDFFGGPVDVPLDEYLAVKDKAFGLVSRRHKKHIEPKGWSNYAVLAGN